MSGEISKAPAKTIKERVYDLFREYGIHTLATTLGIKAIDFLIEAIRGASNHIPWALAVGLSMAAVFILHRKSTLFTRWSNLYWFIVVVAPVGMLIFTIQDFAHVDRSVKTQNPAFFTTNDIVNLDNFAHELLQPGRSPAVSRYLTNRFYPETLLLLKNRDEKANPKLTQALINDLNRIITNRLYGSEEAQTFSYAVKIEKVAKLLEIKGSTWFPHLIARIRNDQREESDAYTQMLWANRMLIEEAYPSALKPHIRLSDFFLLVATLLVYFMQFGFIAFEAGEVHKSYRLESAAKNVLVFITSFATYVGVSHFGIQCLVHNALLAHQTNLELVYHAGFASTVALIIANTITERTSVTANMLLAFVTAGIGYPLISGLVWEDGWLYRHGFLDTAGASVVHLFGGTIGFFVAIFAGPSFRTRIWYLLQQPREPDQRSLMPLTFMGGLFLWFGWLGFNSGSSATADPYLLAFRNSSLGVCGGVAASIILFAVAYCLIFFEESTSERSGWRRRKVASILPVLNALVEWERVVVGMMGGLVCVTANASSVSGYAALVESFIGGGVAVLISAVMSGCFRRRFDDPLGAFATHAVAGFVGVCFLNSIKWFGGETHISVQILGCGVAICAGWFIAVAMRLVIHGLVAATEHGWLRILLQLVRLRLSFLHQATGTRGIESRGPRPHIRGDDQGIKELWECEDWTTNSTIAPRVGEYLIAEDRAASPKIYDIVSQIVHESKNKGEREKFAVLALIQLNDRNEFLYYSSRFTARDIKNAGGLVNKLQNDKDPFAVFVRSRLQHTTKALLPAFPNIDHDEFKKTLAAELNAIIKQPQLWSFDSQNSKRLEQATVNFEDPTPKGFFLEWINRARLQEAFPNTLAPMRNVLSRCIDLAELTNAPGENDEFFEALVLAIAFLAEDLATSKELINQSAEQIEGPAKLFQRAWRFLIDRAEPKNRYASNIRETARIGKHNLAATLLAAKVGLGKADNKPSVEVPPAPVSSPSVAQSIAAV